MLAPRGCEHCPLFHLMLLFYHVFMKIAREMQKSMMFFQKPIDKIMVIAYNGFENQMMGEMRVDKWFWFR